MAEDEDLQLLRATRPYLGVRNLFALVWLLELHERPEDAALPRPTTRAPNLASSMLRRAADEFANPTGSAARALRKSGPVRSDPNATR